MSIRISGISLPDHKKIGSSLTDIYGIGPSMCLRILRATGIKPETLTKDLIDKEEHLLREYIDKHIKIEGELKREIAVNIKRQRDIGTYRGLRHARHLPVRGQRTRTNSRTVRGNIRKTAGSGRKSSAEKT